MGGCRGGGKFTSELKTERRRGDGGVGDDCEPGGGAHPGACVGGHRLRHRRLASNELKTLAKAQSLPSRPAGRASARQPIRSPVPKNLNNARARGSSRRPSAARVFERNGGLRDRGRSPQRRYRTDDLLPRRTHRQRFSRGQAFQAGFVALSGGTSARRSGRGHRTNDLFAPS